MKKTICFILAVLLLFVGCTTQESDNKWKPQVVSDNIKPYAEKTLDLVDQYLAFEISLEELNAGLEEVFDRFDWYESLTASNQASHADIAAFSAIWDLYLYYDYFNFNDNAFRMYRDILRFQLGQNVRGATHSPTKTIRTGDEESQSLAKNLKLQEFPIFDAYVDFVGDPPLPSISLTFDLANNVIPEDVFSYCKTLIKQVKKLEIGLDSLTIYYHIYGQAAFEIDVSLYDSGEYSLALNLINDEAAEPEYIEATDENIERMVVAATAYVSDYMK